MCGIHCYVKSQQYSMCSVHEPWLVVLKKYRSAAVCCRYILQQVSH